MLMSHGSTRQLIADPQAASRLSVIGAVALALASLGDKSADLPSGYRPHRFPSSSSAGRLSTRAGHLGRVHLRLRRALLQCRPRRGDAAKRDRPSPALLHLVRTVDRTEPEDGADGGA